MGVKVDVCGASLDENNNEKESSAVMDRINKPSWSVTTKLTASRGGR